MVTPADSQDLTTLANVKLELGITTTAEDATIAMWIDQASGVVSDYCNRSFGQETVLETIRNRQRSYGPFWTGLGGGYSGYSGAGIIGGFGTLGREIEAIILRRNPIVSITSVVEDGNTLVEGTDFEADYTNGIMTRLDGNGFERRWYFQNLLVTYVAGYELLGTLPIAIERATITLVKVLRAAATRDPFLMTETIPGVRTAQYAVGRYAGTGTGATTWPPEDVINAIAPYRQIDV